MSTKTIVTWFSGLVMVFCCEWAWAEGADASVLCLTTAADGSIYVGGDFQTVGGIVVNHVAKWNGIAWSALGTGTTSPVRSLAVFGTNVYAASGNSVLKWNGTSWSTVFSGNGPVYSVITDPQGNIYAGGISLAYSVGGNVVKISDSGWTD